MEQFRIMARPEIPARKAPSRATKEEPRGLPPFRFALGSPYYPHSF